jgi:hypothetical protein
LQIASRLKTVNELRVKNGDAPYDDPQYDEPSGGGTVTIGEGDTKAVYGFAGRREIVTAGTAAADPLRFDPVEQMGPILRPTNALYSDLMTEMIDYIETGDRLASLRKIAEALDEDASDTYNRRRINEAVEAMFLPFDWQNEQADRITADFVDPYERVYTSGAKTAERKILKTMGRSWLINPNEARFELVNQHVKYALEARADFWIDRGLGEAYEQAKSTMTTEYFAKYKNFADEALVSSLKTSFDYVATWEAQRTARTETHIVGQTAQQKMFDASGVEGRGWRHSGNPNGRANHIALHEKEINLAKGESFSVGAYSAVGPGDPSLGVEELANCGCDSYPVIILAEGIKLWDGS